MGREPIKKTAEKLWASCTRKRIQLHIKARFTQIIIHMSLLSKHSIYHMKGNLSTLAGGTFKVQNHISPKKRVHFEDKTLTPNSLS
jgi:hypothetical protein